MKALFLAVTLIAGLSAQAQAITTYHCTPENPKIVGFNYVQILMDDRADYSMAIEWSRPVGRESVEEVSAEYYDDMTMEGYYAESLDASLMLFTADDVGGERAVFKIDGREHLVTCQ